MDDRIVFFDLETGGLEPGRRPVIQFAGIALDGAWNEVEALEFKIAFDVAAADPAALAVNHYSAEAWAEAHHPALAVSAIGNFFRRHSTLRKISKAQRPYSVARVAAHNARFDCDHLGAFFKARNEFCPAALYEPLDTLALARWVSFVEAGPGPADHKLPSLCPWLGIEHQDAHEALADVRATIQVARRLLSKLRNTGEGSILARCGRGRLRPGAAAGARMEQHGQSITLPAWHCGRLDCASCNSEVSDGDHR